MKKYIVGLFALILGVGLSAFTASESKRLAPGGNKNTETFFWYHVDALGNALVNSPAFEGAEVTQEYADINSGCTQGNNADCIRGYDSQLSADDPGPGDAIPVRRQ